MKLLFSVIGLALATLRENKIRSFLTVLGVIIGTGTIIAVGSILAGLDGAVTGVIRSMGTSTAIVFKMRMGPSFGGRTAEERNRKPLTYEDAQAIADRCPSVDHVSPYLFPQFNGRARYKGNDYLGPQVAGTNENYATSGQAEMLSGRFFTGTEDRHHMPVAVIGEDIYKALFGLEDAIGKKIEVAGAELEVVGVMKRPASSLPGQDDNRVLLPYFTMHKAFPSARENLLLVMANYSYSAKQGDRAQGYANRLVEDFGKKSKPEGVSDADWEKQKAASLGRGYWVSGLVSGEKNQYLAADKSLRAALPYLKGNNAMMSPALFYLGVANYNLGKAAASKAKILEGAKFSDDCAALHGDQAQQAAKNSLVMKADAAKMR